MVESLLGQSLSLKKVFLIKKLKLMNFGKNYLYIRNILKYSDWTFIIFDLVKMIKKINRYISIFY